jgi:hypothetical protein
MNELGTIISSLESPSTNEFHFVVNSKGVRKGQYVQVGEAAEPIVAIISDIFSSNRYFERAESIAEYEKNFAKNGGSFLDHFPVSDWEFLVAKCAIQGLYRPGRPSGRVSLPPSPGAKVYEASNKVIEDFLKLDPAGLHLGKMLAHDVDVRVGLGNLLQKHLAILAMSGAGKSVLATVIIEELLSRPKDSGRIGAVVFDVHGEYLSFADKRRNFEWAEKTEVVDARKIRIATWRLGTRIREYLPDATDQQARMLGRAIERLKDYRDEEGNRVPFGLEEVEKLIEADDELKENVKDALLPKVGELKSLHLFGKADFPKAKNVVSPGKLFVFDLSNVTNQRRKQVIVAYFAGRLFSLRHKEKIPPFALFLEEAHNFAPEKAKRGAAISKMTIEKIAREGRKFGACLCLISQRPVHLSVTTLAQCNTFCVLRVTNPNDLKHIGESCEAVDAGSLAQITTLRVGEGILLGEAVSSPVFLKVRMPRSAKTGRGGALEDIAKKYESAESGFVSDADVEAFI